MFEIDEIKEFFRSVIDSPEIKLLPFYAILIGVAVFLISWSKKYYFKKVDEEKHLQWIVDFLPNTISLKDKIDFYSAEKDLIFSGDSEKQWIKNIIAIWASKFLDNNDILDSKEVLETVVFVFRKLYETNGFSSSSKKRKRYELESDSEGDSDDESSSDDDTTSDDENDDCETTSDDDTSSDDDEDDEDDENENDTTSDDEDSSPDWEPDSE